MGFRVGFFGEIAGFFVGYRYSGFFVETQTGFFIGALDGMALGPTIGPLRGEKVGRRDC